jgi:preprotein translocase subunit SecB
MGTAIVEPGLSFHIAAVPTGVVAHRLGTNEFKWKRETKTMSEGDGKNRGTGAHDKPAGPPVQVNVVGQYVKDLSFENPNVGKLLKEPGDNPNLQLSINVNAQGVGQDLYESAIDFNAQASNQRGTVYELEIVYAGLFKIQNIPAQALEPFLLVNCPSILFPFLRRIVADISREGGFPPLLLDPFDFAALYIRRQQELAAKAAPRTN